MKCCPLCEAGIPLKKGSYFSLENENPKPGENGYIFLDEEKIKEIESQFKIDLKSKNIKFIIKNPLPI